MSDAARPEAARLYIDLLKRCVSNSIYDDDMDMMKGENVVDAETGRYVVVDPARVTLEEKYLGLIWPTRAHTMIGMPRLENLQMCVETVLQDRIPGDLIETGVWRGGASIFMRGILKAYGVTDRVVWAADSFAGLPPPDFEKYPREAAVDFSKVEALAVSLEDVRTNFARYGLLDDQVRFLKGWFKDTLSGAPIERLAVARLDGDLYESTMDALTALYPKLSPGGYVIIDDYNSFESCNIAVNDFRRDQGISAPLSLIPGAGAFWRK
jgi:hypothetical protein